MRSQRDRLQPVVNSASTTCCACAEQNEKMDAHLMFQDKELTPLVHRCVGTFDADSSFWSDDPTVNPSATVSWVRWHDLYAALRSWRKRLWTVWYDRICQLVKVSNGFKCLFGGESLMSQLSSGSHSTTHNLESTLCQDTHLLRRRWMPARLPLG